MPRALAMSCSAEPVPPASVFIVVVNCRVTAFILGCADTFVTSGSVLNVLSIAMRMPFDLTWPLVESTSHSAPQTPCAAFCVAAKTPPALLLVAASCEAKRLHPVGLLDVATLNLAVSAFACLMTIASHSVSSFSVKFVVIAVSDLSTTSTVAHVPLPGVVPACACPPQAMNFFKLLNAPLAVVDSSTMHLPACALAWWVKSVSTKPSTAPPSVAADSAVAPPVFSASLSFVSADSSAVRICVTSARMFGVTARHPMLSSASRRASTFATASVSVRSFSLVSLNALLTPSAAPFSSPAISHMFSALALLTATSALLSGAHVPAAHAAKSAAANKLHLIALSSSLRATKNQHTPPNHTKQNLRF
ncbi:hypothetical protein, conserved in T. vivax [Trypanosoma vivax Y486]|uniref:Uncharacterized protein n=1 Tax=Trypanosoma vivax (strain Y486) TaxID=1055687 RepID=F9WUC7_TRYVY|nr:hypothetical protein, conserved in T. vivax [Trypanosoma vivax Y486]|eukprot:CCD21176.1 hypothetical protein, conserved in T. vivax [Trypanosoma vivax Y486]